MYVRDAKNRDEVWLLDRIEEAEIDDPAFRSRDYVIALDEESSRKAGFGRIRVHKTEAGNFCELAFVYTLPPWRQQGVAAHVIERLVAEAGDEGYETVYTFTRQPSYFTPFNFEPLESSDLPEPVASRLETVRAERGDEVIAMRVHADDFTVPEEYRERFKNASPADEPEDGEVPVEETAEDFGIDPDEATYKYDTGS
ncbi:GNAT family N-acetyltransferase [Halobellus sp. Atlit-38R]|uniref:GNAT family N-acetyltransferase n=1 Tax=Halobellus sp. Atlit-38R TaxID=2282131 RepID=UPI000EF23C2B|nr:GNAT family N-acetyltransferase [Halobellus sp. Atlit-38R]RLM88106.1 GNAT family N-acetyltransferase [Halobellus sp. Atlit-38R]